MNKDTDQRLTALLKSRVFIPARDNLADRIISAARSLPQRHHESLFDWLQGLFAGFPIPRPFYVQAFILILMFGFLIGLTVPVVERPTGNDSPEIIYIQEFLYATGAGL